MKLKALHVRFYKSFNFDYLVKYHESRPERPWELLDGMWYPFVEVPIDGCITTVVGANESGKTHLLTAIEKGLTGEDIAREDFCRYSPFFTVEQGKMRWPDFGFEFCALTPEDLEAVRAACSAVQATDFGCFFLFRTARTQVTVYLPSGESYSEHQLSDKAFEKLAARLPRTFRIDAEVALPASIPIQRLVQDRDPDETTLRPFERKQRIATFDNLMGIGSILVGMSSVEQLVQIKDQVYDALTPLRTNHGASAGGAEGGRRAAEERLAHDLIRKVANIDCEALTQLYEALRNGEDGFANGLIQRINSSLEARLDLSQWWSQDREFRLTVSAREHDLVFTVRDRTETEYTFNERSSGLRYFLSYYIQYLTHEPRADGTEVLLMDEPDTYLSSQGQQNLLQVLHRFADGEEGPAVQVVYVTHSPFLIDKNHSEYIRVLEKGVGEEGTRVVRDAAKNHYEPLRSALGSLVAETAFMGHCNLMVEGTSDQVLLAGAASYLRGCGAPSLETLDLNRLTIVPMGGASFALYLVYLARGRDVEQPAVVVLLDSDKAGDTAAKELRRGPRGRAVIDASYVVRLGDLAEQGVQFSSKGPDRELEDLVPLPLAVHATNTYLDELYGASPLTVELVQSELAEKGVFDAMAAAVEKLPGEMALNKVGFARAVIASARAAERGKLSLEAGVLEQFETNMRALFRQLGTALRQAEREQTVERVTVRVDRAKRRFLSDHPTGAKREEALILFEEIEAALDDSKESDEIKVRLQQCRRDFALEQSILEPVPEYPRFRSHLEQVRYAGRMASQEAEAVGDGLKAQEAAEPTSAGVLAEAPVPSPAAQVDESTSDEAQAPPVAAVGEPE